METRYGEKKRGILVEPDVKTTYLFVEISQEVRFDSGVMYCKYVCNVFKRDV